MTTDIAFNGRVTEASNERLLARRPAAGLALFLLAMAVFAALLWNFRANGPLIPWDRQVSQDFHAVAVHSSPFVRWLMLTGGFIGQTGVIVLGVALGLILISQRRWQALAMVLLGTVGAEALFQVLSQLIGRHRPVFPDPLEVLTGPGFPSGHMTAGGAFFGLLVYLLWPRVRTGWGRLLLVAGFVVLMLYIAISRLFQGVHYPTDVLAGCALGFAWSVLVVTLVELAARRQA